MSSNNKELWIALAHVEQLARGGTLGDSDRAYVNVMGSAISRADFRRQIKKAVESLELVLLRVENPEPLEMRLSKHSIHRDLSKLAKKLQKTGELGFGVFHAYDLNT